VKAAMEARDGKLKVINCGSYYRNNECLWAQWYKIRLWNTIKEHFLQISSN
jgi:hypothetical protein